MIRDFEHMFPFLVSLVYLLFIFLFLLILALYNNLTYYFTNNGCKLEPMARAACANQNLFRLSYPINKKIVGFSVSIITLLNIFNPYEILSKILQSFFSQLFIIIISCVLNCVWIQRLMRSMLGKFNTKFFCCVTRDRVKHSSMFCEMSK